MKAKKADNIYYLRVDRGEYVIDSIKKICLMYDIKTASISGIGATDKFRCGVYNVNTNVWFTLKDYSSSSSYTTKLSRRRAVYPRSYMCE